MPFKMQITHLLFRPYQGGGYPVFRRFLRIDTVAALLLWDTGTVTAADGGGGCDWEEKAVRFIVVLLVVVGFAAFFLINKMKYINNN